jgi:hypothetical protein
MSDTLAEIIARVEKLESELEFADIAIAGFTRIIADLTNSRDMLARRCAEQAHEIARLISPPLPDADPHAAVLAAVDVLNRQGIH